MNGEYITALLEGRDLVAAALRGELAPVEFRDREVETILAQLDRKRSVLLVGAGGAGKTAVVHGVAGALAKRERTGLRGLSTAQLMSGTRYLGEWETKLAALCERARDEDVVVYWSDVWNLTGAGRTAKSTSNALEALRPHLESGEFRLIAEATPATVRSMSRTPNFVSLFETIELPPLTGEQVAAVLEHTCDRLRVDLDADSRRSLVTLTDRFLATRAQPGPALALLTQVCDYDGQKHGVGEDELLSPEFVEKVFSIYSGLPRFIVSRSATKPTREIQHWFEERIVGQSEAIRAVVETIALFKAGLNDPKRPIGTFLFVGPTGVGKTELARQVAGFLFGGSNRLLRFDLSEFKDHNSFELLVGDPSQSEGPARLLDPVRSHPFQVILFDELEKAHHNVWDLLLPLLDEGTLTPPGGAPVNFRNTIVIATSNAGVKDADRSTGFGGTVSDGTRDTRVREGLEREFRPEFLNRFQHVVVFHPLSKEHVRRVARHELEHILTREGIAARNLVVDVDERALDDAIGTGFDPRYGARALKREIQRKLVLPLAVTLMEREVPSGAVVRIGLTDGKVKVKVIDTPESREARREEAPVRAKTGEKLDRKVLRARIRRIPPLIERLAEGADEKFVREERARLLASRKAAAFWADTESAALATRDLERYSMMLERLDHFRRTAEELERESTHSATRRELETAASRLVSLERGIEHAHREMITIGRDGAWDALVEIRPSGARDARDLLVESYTSWALWKKLEVQWLLEPSHDGEPAFFALVGPYAYGYVHGEAGVHRRRDGDAVSVANVRVVAWGDRREEPAVQNQRALKLAGQYRGKIRSRIECKEGLVLQNANTIAANRELAADVAPSWAKAGGSSDEIVRRYDTSPFRVRDAVTGFTTGHPDALKPRRFHELLCRRIDEARST